ncbi:uncharacterized protein LAESUDRAFT_717340 [Laetiporus sulphureus 93-53]|uniref:Uncharacterized protein n=1 Tax=Laetiporus sulphureus 93-53 TaxID=1314785 RepID=A0A165BU60_9APHY|nr:uncharacterized protein LAESUDRAFT_717340 [Laetiporus sulphureus 93-53]KZT01656.1 hypothetical protein LAESUDRAFT_717340 [Laetiporus sulphureus 93-53]
MSCQLREANTPVIVGRIQALQRTVADNFGTYSLTLDVTRFLTLPLTVHMEVGRFGVYKVLSMHYCVCCKEPRLAPFAGLSWTAQLEMRGTQHSPILLPNVEAIWAQSVPAGRPVWCHWLNQLAATLGRSGDVLQNSPSTSEIVVWLNKVIELIEYMVDNPHKQMMFSVL